MMRTFRLHGGSALLPASTGLLHRLSAVVVQGWHERIRRRAASAALSHLNDHLLRDIGLTRADVMSVRDSR